jgi:ATP/maltotriose-dependent transcriptional regulator MalT
MTIIRTWQTRRLLARAWRALLALDVSAASLLVSQLERSLVTTPAGADISDYNIAVLRAALLALQDDSMAALPVARRAHQPGADMESRTLATMICRWAYWRTGRMNEFHGTGRAQWCSGLRRCRAITTIFDLNLEAAVEFGRLRMTVSRTLAAEALERARQTACSESSAGLLAATLVAQVAYEQGQLDEAELMIRYRMSMIRTSATIECVLRAYIVLARLAVHRRRPDNALALLSDAQALGERRCWPALVAAMLAERARILLDENEENGARASVRDLDTLLRSASEAIPSGGAQADMEIQGQLAQLRFRLRHVGAAQTATAVEGLRQKALARSDLRLALEMHLVSVAAFARCGEIEEAQERLIDALDVGATHGLCMTYIDAGDMVRKLLGELCHDLSVSDERVLELRPYIHTLLSRSPRSQLPVSGARRAPEASRQPLTPRESNVLRLIAGGLSNKRIAQRLDIAPETVKSHTKSIFAKLAAQTRAQAVAHGEALGLIQG